ncbi:hypothetical protein Pcinc_039324 [Petrolisthes cinctipes]|uniref:Protein transport protein SEC23 n=1 Tax=Petrolisthes cinctipes TaxID=88211 RepID=A0AAE1BP71_PETCI|nr:hypothetical protein Pcinc_039324 [Petrolisthes cinctipes]
MVLADSFTSSLFAMTFERVFARDGKGNLEMAFNATLEVKTSQELKIAGALGPCVSSYEYGHNVTDVEKGIGHTNKWKMGGLIPTTTITIIFEVANQRGNDVFMGKDHVQFITHYQTASGQSRVRVTTISRNWVTLQTRKQLITQGFDEETAAVVMARLVVHQAETQQDDVLSGIDEKLVRLCSTFGEFTPKCPESFKFPGNFCLYPQIMFHLRRSQFIQVFNNSPDETSFYRSMLKRQCVIESLTMIQPVLYSYSFSGSKAVMLDISSIQPDHILLLDTYFLVLIFLGETVAAWKKEGYHEQQEYAHFKDFLQCPLDDAQDIISNRFPVPRYVETQHGASEARFLLARVNPSQN